MMQPLLLLKQTLEVAYDPGPLLLDGTNVNFSTVGEMLWRGRGEIDAPNHFRVSYDDPYGESTGLTFVPATHGIELAEMRHREADEPERLFYPGMTQDELNESVPEAFRSVKSTRDLDYALRRNRCFFEITFEGFPAGIGLGPATSLHSVATSLIHLPGLRDNPLRFYPATQVGDVFPGVFQPYVASVIQGWADSKDDRLQVLGRQLQDLGLTWKVTTQRIDDTRVALRVGRLPKGQRGGAKDLVNIVDVGLGVSQTLPILVALLLARPGQVVFLEQPEIHLHPRAQVALAEILLEASGRGVQVITETHSYLLLRAIQEASVRRGDPVSTVGLNWFSRDPDGVTHVDSATLDAAGSFGDWPADFADVEMDIEDRYLEAAMQARLAGR
jgi:hypothetical protein